MPASQRAVWDNGVSTIPIVSSGNWHVDGFGSAAQGPTIVVSRAYFVPIWPGRECTLTDIAMNVGAAFSTPGTLRAGLYTANMDTYRPSALVGDYSTVVEATGSKAWTGITAALGVTMYFACVVAQGGTGGTPTWSSRNCSHPLITETNASAPNPNTQRSAYYSDTGYSGTLPAAAGAMAGIIVGPSLAFKLTVP